MFNLLFYLNLILIFITLNNGKINETSEWNNNNVDDKTTWPNLWFPFPSNYHKEVNSENATVADWDGLVFPYPSNYSKDTVKKYECDNGKDDIRLDYDPHDIRHSFNYLCLANRKEYTPNLNRSALMKIYVIPPAYQTPAKCLNEVIEYSEPIPTFGAYRPLLPKFGTYQFLPAQRWLHSLAEGAIVLLYHPCTFAGEIVKLQNILRGCLYRHIITPSQLLTPEYPLALLAWGKSLRMSAVNEPIVVKFIKDNAKKGFRQKSHKLKISPKLYEAGLLNEAHLVTDEQDSVICGYKEMR